MSAASRVQALKNNSLEMQQPLSCSGFDRIAQMEEWFADCGERLNIIVKKILADESNDWQTVCTGEGKLDYIAHRSGRIHRIVFLRVWESLRREWVDRCLLEPIAEGQDGVFSIILLASYQDQYLVQAKGEPGNNTPHHVVLTPTVQTSFVNLDMKLSGDVLFAELYHHPACKKLLGIQDGGQLFNKVAQICTLELEEKPAETPANFYWATLEEIKYFAQKGLVSEHLLQTLGLLYLELT
jgi:hypothetical protein